MRRGAVLLLAALLAGLVSSCSTAVPPVPLGARNQTPSGGGPDIAWNSRDARLTAVNGGTRLTARAALRRQLDGQVRMTLTGEDGSALGELVTTVDGVQTYSIAPPWAPYAGDLAQLARQAWGRAKDDPHWLEGWVVGSWNGAERIYGGDPLALRRATLGSTEITVEDFRWDPVGLVAHQVHLRRGSIEVHLTLGVVTHAAPPALPVRPAPPPGAPGGERW
jgi:hypothetical protein